MVNKVRGYSPPPPGYATESIYNVLKYVIFDINILYCICSYNLWTYIYFIYGKILLKEIFKFNYYYHNYNPITTIMSILLLLP